MKLMQQCAAALAACALAFSAVAVPVEVGGVKMAESVTVGGANLQLNGAGVRYKAIFKVYAAGLYLNKKTNVADDALAAPGAKRIAITMLRDIDSNELGKLFTRGVENNMVRSDMMALIPDLIRMGQLFSSCKKLASGDTFTIDWVPQTGTVINISSTHCPPDTAPFKSPQLFTALMRIWLGPKPADWKLKEELLGKAS